MSLRKPNVNQKSVEFSNQAISLRVTDVQELHGPDQPRTEGAPPTRLMAVHMQKDPGWKKGACCALREDPPAKMSTDAYVCRGGSLGRQKQWCPEAGHHPPRAEQQVLRVQRHPEESTHCQADGLKKQASKTRGRHMKFAQVLSHGYFHECLYVNQT